MDHDFLVSLTKNLKKCIICDGFMVAFNDGIYSIYCRCGRGSHSADSDIASRTWNAQARRREVAEKSRDALALHEIIRQAMKNRGKNVYPS